MPCILRDYVFALGLNSNSTCLTYICLPTGEHVHIQNGQASAAQSARDAPLGGVCSTKYAALSLLTSFHLP